MGIKVGIDLGTTFSAVATIDEKTGKPVIIKNSLGSSVTPSVLCFKGRNEVLYGQDAKDEQLFGNENAVAFFKRTMGDEAFYLDFFGKRYTSTDLSAILLRNLKAEAESTIGQKIDSAVITVPAYFTHKERTATIEAGKLAGINVTAIINEPTAAAFAYGLNECKKEQTVIIYDLGGGTFDVTVAKINKDEITILGSDGDHALGGKDWDDCVVGYLCDMFEEETNIDIREDREMLWSLYVVVENAKKQLTSKNVAKVPINYNGKKVNIELTLETFEELTSHLVNITADVIERLLKSIGTSWSDIDGTILVGGSTRMRMVRSYIEKMTGKAPLGGVNVDEAVALGAAIRANIDESGKSVLAIGEQKKSSNSALQIMGAKAITDVTSHSMGMIAASSDNNKYINSIIIKKNSVIPAENTKAYTLRTKKEGNELEIYVLQGEYERPLDNTITNKYVITDIAHTDKKEAIINVTYKYDADGVINVSAVQADTGKSLPIKTLPIPENMDWTDLSPREVARANMPSMEIIMAIDISGSMAIDLSGNMRGVPLEEAKKAMMNLVSELEGVAKIGIVEFGDTSKCVLHPTSDKTDIAHAIHKLSAACGGNSQHPLDMIYHILNNSKADLKYGIILTDGIWACQTEAIKSAKKCHKKEIEIMAIGFSRADYQFLKQIASTEELAKMTDLSNLGDQFSKIAKVISSSSSAISI